MLSVIGVHSNVAGPKANRTDGHAWISLHFSNGKSATVGLWTNRRLETRKFIKDPVGVLSDSQEKFEVEWNREKDRKGYEPVASRYYGLSEAQGKQAIKVLGSYTGWRFSNTCASWATRVVRVLFGEELASEELGGITNTPRALGDAILKAEKASPTSLERPLKTCSNAIKKASFGSSI
jgi:hypothetical protein